jgi:hypothetical protein
VERVRKVGKFLVGDIVIIDKELIEEVLAGKRQVSAGYTCDNYIDTGGRVCQRVIRGNHIAVVHEGRAGRQVAICDSKEVGMKRKGRKDLGFLIRALVKSVADAKPEEQEEMAEKASEILEDNVDEEAVSEDSNDIDIGDILQAVQALHEKVDKLLSVLIDKETGDCSCSRDEEEKASEEDSASEESSSEESKEDEVSEGEAQEEESQEDSEEETKLDSEEALIEKILKRLADKRDESLAEQLVEGPKSKSDSRTNPKSMLDCSKCPNRTSDSRKRLVEAIASHPHRTLDVLVAEADAKQREYDLHNPHNKKRQ